VTFVLRRAFFERRWRKRRKKTEAQAWWDGLTEEQREAEKKKAKDARDARMLLLGIVGAVTP
jgi:hypothetical protein